MQNTSTLLYLLNLDQLITIILNENFLQESLAVIYIFLQLRIYFAKLFLHLSKLIIKTFTEIFWFSLEFKFSDLFVSFLASEELLNIVLHGDVVAILNFFVGIILLILEILQLIYPI